MNWTQLHQKEVNARIARRQKPVVRASRLRLNDLGKIATAETRAASFKHFCNLLSSYQQNNSQELRKQIVKMATNWNFMLPAWF